MRGPYPKPDTRPGYSLDGEKVRQQQYPLQTALNRRGMTSDEVIGAILEIQATISRNAIVWEQEKRVYEDMVYDLQKRVAALEKAPQTRNEEFTKLWNWVKALEQRVIRKERDEPAEPR